MPGLRLRAQICRSPVARLAAARFRGIIEAKPRPRAARKEVFALMKKILALALMLALLLCGAARAQESVSVYSSLPEEVQTAIYEAFEAETGIAVVAASGNDGELLARLAAEREAPRADVLWGVSVDALGDKKELLQIYDSPQADGLSADCRFDGHYAGFCRCPLLIVYNKELLLGADAPGGWADLLDEAFAGRVALADPAQSEEALSAVCAMILAMGGPDDGGWRYVMDLAAMLNGQALPSVRAVCEAVARGECAVGVAPEGAVFAYAGEGGSLPPGVGVAYPREGTSAAPRGVAAVRGGPNAEAARKFVDFVLGQAVQAMLPERFGLRAARADAPPPDGLPSLDGVSWVDYDEVWAAENAADIVETFGDLLASFAAEEPAQP